MFKLRIEVLRKDAKSVSLKIILQKEVGNLFSVAQEVRTRRKGESLVNFSSTEKLFSVRKRQSSRI